MPKTLQNPMLLLAAVLVMLPIESMAAFRCERPSPEGGTEIVFSDLTMEGYECESLRATPPPAVDPNEAMDNLREQVNALDNGSSASNDETPEVDPDDPRAAQMAENCQISRDNLRVLESEQDVVTTDAEGNKTVLNAEQRQRQLDQARKDIDYFCNP